MTVHELDWRQLQELLDVFRRHAEALERSTEANERIAQALERIAALIEAATDHPF